MPDPLDIIIPKDIEKLVVGEINLLGLFYECRWWWDTGGTYIEVRTLIERQSDHLERWCIGAVVPVWITVGIDDHQCKPFDGISFEVIRQEECIEDDRVSYMVRLREVDK